MNDLKKINDIVYTILLNDEQARNSDAYLFTQVVKHVSPFLYLMPFFTAMTDPNMPSYKSVSRTRRKLQEKHPELQATEAVKEKREENINTYLEYALFGQHRN